MFVSNHVLLRFFEDLKRLALLIVLPLFHLLLLSKVAIAVFLEVFEGAPAGRYIFVVLLRLHCLHRRSVSLVVNAFVFEDLKIVAWVFAELANFH